MPQQPAPLSFGRHPDAASIAIDGPTPINAFWWQCPWKSTSGPVFDFHAMPRSPFAAA